MRDAAEERPAWAWIDLEALRHNTRRAVACAEGRAVIAVVKADAYGHGAADIGRALLAENITRFAVVSVGEGADLRRAGIVAPILLMGGLDDRESAERAHKWGLTPVIHNVRGLELASALGSTSSPVAVEIEIDTGMRRMGVPSDQATACLERISRTPELSVSGAYTHLACADEIDPAPSRAQVERFAEVLAPMQAQLDHPILHVANSAGLLRRQTIEDAVSGISTQAVRPGLMLYGVSPFPDQSAESLDLRPVMSLAARVVAIRSVAAGEGVGYGGEWRAPQATRVATLPLGYADGIPRAAAGRAEVYLGGAMRKIVGRVSMDYVAVDIGPEDRLESGQAPIEKGSVATLFGTTHEGIRVPVENLAAAAGTIGYEILTGVGARIPRRAADGLPLASDPEPFDPAV